MHTNRQSLAGDSTGQWKQLLSARLASHVAACVALCVLVAEIRAGEPFWSFKNGLSSESPLLRPGKVDFLFSHRETEDRYNAFAWGPMFKGGGGVLDANKLGTSTYVGGFVRPLAPLPEYGDLILGAQAVEQRDRHDHEFQAEYRLPVGLGVGGGFVEGSDATKDLQFGKLTFRQKAGQWNYILEVQGQQYDDVTSPGGYGALYNQELMGVAGTDGEQWRATLGYISSRTNGLLRPAAEVLYVDNTIGDFDGPRQVFANFTLQWKGGFLGHPARLGRAMGPQGLEFGNPLGFLVPTWNRRLEMWEMGGLVDARVEYIRYPNKTIMERYEGLVFPFQFLETKDVLDYLFVGGAYTSNNNPKARKDTPAVIAGVTGKLAFFNVSVGVEYEFRPSATSVVVGVIDQF